MNKTPYLNVVGFPREMGGKGAPQHTVFGVLGHTMEDPYSKSLGGLVANTKVSAPVPKHKSIYSNTVKAMKTEHNIGSVPAPKTHIPGSHMGQVPYPGYYMSAVGQGL